MIDRTAVRAHQHSAGAAKKRSPSDWTFMRQLNQQDTRRGEFAWQACALVTDKWRRIRHQLRSAVDCGISGGGDIGK